MSDRVYYKRQFLNSEDYGGSAIIEANVHEVYSSGEYINVDAEFSIADCGRMITLDFSVSNEESRENALLKIRRLKSAVNEFEVALRGQLDAWERRKKAAR